MIDIKELENNKELYLKAFLNKGYDLKKDVDEAISLNKEYLKLLNKEQEIRSELNILTKQIKTNKDNNLIVKAKEISTLASKIKDEISDLKTKLFELISYFPNINSAEVPVGSDEKDNVFLSYHLDDKKRNDSFIKPHWEIIKSKQMILDEEASFISGTRQIIYHNKASQLIRAIENLMIDNAIESNYIQIETPVIVNKKTLYNTGQLPKFENDLFKLEGEDKYLIPTAEVPLTNLGANKIFNENQLPIKYFANTNCFRKEAGAAGKDTRGLIRLHQFKKVELVKFGKPEAEEKDFNEMLETAKNILEKLKIPYRLVQLCTGDSSFASRKTIDIEVWMPGLKKYLEISSISSMGNFQSRRMKSRYKKDNSKKELIYTYNGSGLAIDRTMAAVIENYYQSDGKIKIPEVLKKYLSFSEF